jgi:hypothetical protein
MEGAHRHLAVFLLPMSGAAFNISLQTITMMRCFGA